MILDCCIPLFKQDVETFVLGWVRPPSAVFPRGHRRSRGVGEQYKEAEQAGPKQRRGKTPCSLLGKDKTRTHSKDEVKHILNTYIGGHCEKCRDLQQKRKAS